MFVSLWGVVDDSSVPSQTLKRSETGGGDSKLRTVESADLRSIGTSKAQQMCSEKTSVPDVDVENYHNAIASERVISDRTLLGLGSTLLSSLLRSQLLTLPGQKCTYSDLPEVIGRARHWKKFQATKFGAAYYAYVPHCLQIPHFELLKEQSTCILSALLFNMIPTAGSEINC